MVDYISPRRSRAGEAGEATRRQKEKRFRDRVVVGTVRQKISPWSHVSGDKGNVLAYKETALIGATREVCSCKYLEVVLKVFRLVFGAIEGNEDRGVIATASLEAAPIESASRYILYRGKGFLTKILLCDIPGPEAATQTPVRCATLTDLSDAKGKQRAGLTRPRLCPVGRKVVARRRYNRTNRWWGCRFDL